MKACKNTELRKGKKNRETIFFTEILRSHGFGLKSQILHNF